MRPSSEKTIKKTLAPFLCLLTSLCWAGGAANPDDVTLLKKAFESPTFSYQGHMTISHWYGARTKTEDADVWFKPPNSYRWEFLTPEGKIDRVHVRNGETERLHLAGNDTVLLGQAAKSSPKNITADQEWDLLNKNYRIFKVGTELVCGKTAEIIELSPIADGKPKQQIWIDHESGMALAIKRFREGGHLASHSRFTQFQKNPTLSDDKFSVSGDSQTTTKDHGYDQSFLSPAEFQEKRTGKGSALPEKLPLGFELESANVFSSDSHSVDHYRYTDGMTVLSIFETSKPSRFSAFSAKDPGSLNTERVGPFQVTDSGHVLHREFNHRYFTLISDVSEEALDAVAQSLK